MADYGQNGEKFKKNPQLKLKLTIQTNYSTLQKNVTKRWQQTPLGPLYIYLVKGVAYPGGIVCTY